MAEGPTVACWRCGSTGKLSVGTKLPKDWTCHKCAELIEVEEVAAMETTDLIDALITSAIEHHECASWRSISTRKLLAIRSELNTRLPPPKTR